MFATHPSIRFIAPYGGEVTVSATFVPLGADDKWNVAKIEDVTLGSHKGTISGSEITIEGLTRADDLTKLVPEFTLSKGARVANADTLHFKNMTRTKVTVTSEDKSRSRDYYVTVYKVDLAGTGTENDPFLIESTSDFRAFIQYHPEKYYLQKADLNLNGFTAQQGGAIVGTYGRPFKGVYDGGGYKITGLQLKNENITGCAALFHTVSGTVKNLTIDSSCSFTARQWVGSFALYLKDGGTLENCVNEASVTCKPSDKMQGGSDYTLNCFAGGIVGPYRQQLAQRSTEPDHKLPQ